MLLDILEMMFFFLKIITARKQSILLCALYRPQWQGNYPSKFLPLILDNLMMCYNYSNIILFCDWNQNFMENSFDVFLTVCKLYNYLDFPTNKLDSSLDPVVSDIPSLLCCKPLNTVGTSDHIAVFTRFVTDVGEDNRKEDILAAGKNKLGSCKSRSSKYGLGHTAVGKY